MSRVIVVVEGASENRFIDKVIAPHLALHGVYLSARILGKPGHKGGNVQYARARLDILTLLRTDQQAICTTMFDFYALPDSWPARLQAGEETSSVRKAAIIEVAVLDDIQACMGDRFNSARFIPYIQMHEFEALLFSNLDILVAMLGSPRADSLREIRQHPEKIDDGPLTAPSKRILAVKSGYRKTQGYLIAQQIGLAAMRKHCPHFDGWIARLEALREGL